jgi:hypothetical protein
MAKIEYGPLVSQISGSIGSATFQKSFFGNTLRTKPIPRKSSTPMQSIYRRYMCQIHAEWALLTAAQRNQWNQYISYTGQTINGSEKILLNGHSLFIKYNFMRLMANIGIVREVTFSPIPMWTTLLHVAFHDGDLYAYFTDLVVAYGLYFLLSVSTPRPPTQSFSDRGLLIFNGVFNGPGPMYCANWQGAMGSPPGSYERNFGFVPSVGNVLHCKLQWFLSTAPAYSGFKTSTTSVVAFVP